VFFYNLLNLNLRFFIRKRKKNNLHFFISSNFPLLFSLFSVCTYHWKLSDSMQRRFAKLKILWEFLRFLTTMKATRRLNKPDPVSKVSSYLFIFKKKFIFFFFFFFFSFFLFLLFLVSPCSYFFSFFTSFSSSFFF